MSLVMNVEVNDDKAKVSFVGPVDESVGLHLSKLFELPAKEFEFDFKDLNYINSSGVRSWINFIRDFRDKRLITLTNCPPNVVMQINMIPSFSAGCKIRSVIAPFVCDECDQQKTILYSGDAMPKATDKIPTIMCEDCEVQMDFEEDDNFFEFNDENNQ